MGKGLDEFKWSRFDNFMISPLYLSKGFDQYDFPGLLKGKTPNRFEAVLIDRNSIID